MKKIFALTLSLMIMITSFGFGATATTTGTTFKTVADVYGIWMSPKGTDGYLIDQSGTYLVLREKGTTKVTYVANTAKNKKPVLVKDKKSVTFEYVGKGYSSRGVAIKKDAKGNSILVEGSVEYTTAKGLKFYSNKDQYAKYLQTDEKAIEKIIGEKSVGGDYSWLKPGASGFDISKSTNAKEIMSVYGPSPEETDEWKIFVGPDGIEYAKDGFANMTNSGWELRIMKDTIEISFMEGISDTEFAVMADALSAIYPTSAKIDDVSNRMIKDINSTKIKTNLGYTSYLVDKLNDKTVTVNGIKWQYDSLDANFEIIIFK